MMVILVVVFVVEAVVVVVVVVVVALAVDIPVSTTDSRTGHYSGGKADSPETVLIRLSLDLHTLLIHAVARAKPEPPNPSCPLVHGPCDESVCCVYPNTTPCQAQRLSGCSL